MRVQPYAGIVFDLDGTLVDTETFYREAFMAAAACIGITVPEGFHASLVGISTRERTGLLQAAFGPDFPIELFLATYYARRAALLPARIPLLPGAQSLLRRLQLPRAVATSASRKTAMSHLRRSGLAAHFEHVLTRDDVGRGKPAPDLFLAAAVRLGLAPHRCLAVEDSANGAMAALAAGMQVALVAAELPPSLRHRGVQLHADLLAVGELLEGRGAGIPEPAPIFNR